MADLLNQEDLIEHDGQQQPSFEALEQYQRQKPTLNRMSLFKQFDPLVTNTPISNNLERPNLSITSALQQINLDDNDNSPLKNNDIISSESSGQAGNEDSMLVKFGEDTENTISNGNGYIQQQPVNKSIINNKTNDEDSTLHLQQQIVQMNEEIGNLKSENETLLEVLTDFSSFTQFILNSSMATISNDLEASNKKDEELNKLTLIKGQLEEDMNGVEKNYYEIHSRYNQLRSLVKEMDQREENNKAIIADLNYKLREKEQLIESAAQRMQSGASNETSLRAQIKVLDMKVNSLQAQLDQKNRENEELSNIVNELIANNNAN